MYKNILKLTAINCFSTDQRLYGFMDLEKNKDFCLTCT